jgi:hypothetical protein
VWSPKAGQAHAPEKTEEQRTKGKEPMADQRANTQHRHRGNNREHKRAGRGREKGTMQRRRGSEKHTRKEQGMAKGSRVRSRKGRE